MKNHCQIIPLLLFLFVSFNLSAQTWKSIVTSNCTEVNEGISTKLYKGKQYFTGIYRGNMNIGFNSAFGWAHDDIFIGKSDLNGSTEWLINIRGNQIDRSNHIDVIDNKVVVSGTFSDTLLIGNDTLVNENQRAVFMAFFDTLGNHISTFQPDVYNTEIRHFQEDINGHIIIAGDMYLHLNHKNFSMNSNTGFNFFLLKYDPFQDSVIWGVQATQGSSQGQRVSIDQENNIYVIGQYNDGTYLIDTLLNTGNSNHNAFISKFDTDGNKVWLRTIEGEAEVHCYGVACDDSSNVFLVGEFEGEINIDGTQYSSNGFYDALMIKYDQYGAVKWSEVFSGVNSNEGYDIVMDSNMDPIVLIEAGEDASYKGQTFSINGWNEPVVVKVKNGDGEIIWYKNLESTTTSGLVNGMSISYETDFIALTGINRSSVLFNENNYSAANGKDFYAMILEDSLTYLLNVLEDDLSLDIIIYPNPVSDFLTIRSTEQMNKIEIFNLNGQKVIGTKFLSDETQVSVKSIKAGLYIVHITFGDLSYQTRITVN